MPYSEKITSVIHWQNWGKFRIDALMSSILESQHIVSFFAFDLCEQLTPRVTSIPESFSHFHFVSESIWLTIHTGLAVRAEVGRFFTKSPCKPVSESRPNIVIRVHFRLIPNYPFQWPYKLTYLSKLLRGIHLGPVLPYVFLKCSKKNIQNNVSER